jgi:hypothetical protein
LFGEAEKRGQILSADRDVLNGGPIFLEAFERSAGVARSAPELGRVRGLSEFPNEGVFAAAGTEDENFHKRGRTIED